MVESTIPDLSQACDDLLRVVEVLHPKLQGDISLPSDAPETAAACLSLLRAMVRQAEVIILVAEPGFSEEASANLRVILEAWMNLIYLISRDGDDSAVRYRVFALLEFRDHLNESTLDPGDVREIGALIDELRAANPAIVEATELQRTGKVKGQSRLYWSGLSPTRLLEKAANSLPADAGDQDQLRRFYKFTSWDAHHVLTPVLNVDREKFRAGLLRLGRRQPAEEAAKSNCFLATSMLKQASTLVMRRWPGLIDRRNTMRRS